MVITANSVFDRINASVHELPVVNARKFAFRAMGTLCQITFSTGARVAGEQFKLAAVRWVADFEARYSRFIPESLIGRINRSAGRDWVEVDEETERMFALCNELYFCTRGAFDPTALPLIKLWDWKAEPPVIPDATAINAARELVGWPKVQRKKGAIFLPRAGMSIDLGGIGKEYAVDRVVQLAAEHGIENVLVDFGQDLRVQGQPSGKKAWHIGLEDPMNPGKCWTGVAVKDKAVATSGDYLRNFQAGGRRYGHILDPRSGYPVDNSCRAVSVVAPTCTIAGILSTTAFILGPTEGLNLISTYMGADGCIITEHNRYQTRRFHEYVTR
ncbi:MAG: FAD:protein FMN transferase [Verrucomicrobia bacterium]|nr:FAD:protein FMN transferase [Verrucomicrobiota bacterium]